MKKLITFLFFIVLFQIGCSSVPRYTSIKTQTERPEKDEYKLFQVGIASFYGDDYQGKLTANGEKFNKNAKTAAHKELPFDTNVRVINTYNQKSVIVRINDRGPYKDNRIIDLSEGAAIELEMIEDGVVPVRIEIKEWNEKNLPK